MEFMFLLIVMFFKQAGKLFTWDSSSRHAFNALDTWQVPIAFASDEGVASSSAPFHSVYKGGPPPHFPYFIFADL